ncbi:MAG: DNA-3-methyladenine glycosylase [Candidatus Sulfotelmatobacter sp.]
MAKEANEVAVATIRPLGRAFFGRDPRRVARELLGKVLVRQNVGRQGQNARQNGRYRLTARIVEVEAYLGKKDPASHAAAGNTKRTSVLFGPPGFAYVYFIYGAHYCLNVSCDWEGKAGGVLFRALEPLLGIEEMAVARGVELRGPRDLPKLTSGPGRLAQAFGITRVRDNGCDLTSPHSSLWIGEDGFRSSEIRVTPRIGISKAAERPLRYLLAGNRFVSGRLASTSATLRRELPENA